MGSTTIICLAIALFSIGLPCVNILKFIYSFPYWYSMFPSAQTQQFPWKVLLLGHRIYVYSILLDNITLYPIVMVAIYFCNYLCFCLPVNPYFFHDFILSVFFKFAFHCLWIIKWKTLHDFWSLVFPTLSNICFYFSICFLMSCNSYFMCVTQQSFIHYIATNIFFLPVCLWSFYLNCGVKSELAIANFKLAHTFIIHLIFAFLSKTSFPIANNTKMQKCSFILFLIV